jgi:hypothetical protein
MTVGELLNELENYDADMRVRIWDTRIEAYAPVGDVTALGDEVQISPEEEDY